MTAHKKARYYEIPSLQNHAVVIMLQLTMLSLKSYGYQQ